jgi:PAS domain S-box-containing protein
LVNKRKEGSFYTEEMTIAPVKDTRGQITHFIAIKQDITTRTEAEIGLRQSEERFRFLVTSIPHLVWSARPNGTIDYVNTRALAYAGMSMEQLENWNWISILHPDDIEHTKQIWENAFTSGQEYQIEYRLRRADGQYRWHFAHALPLRDAQGQIIRWFGTCTDIHDRKKAQEMLTKAQKELREHTDNLEKTVEERTAKLRELVGELEHFSYTITHDMRAPLRAMQGFAQLMLQGPCKECTDALATDFLQRIITSADRMDALITDALNYTRAVGTELKLEPVDIDSLLRGMLQSYPDFQHPSAEILLEGVFPVILGNEAALTQCFSNLLNNAVKFVGPGTTPHVRVWSERGTREGAAAAMPPSSFSSAEPITAPAPSPIEKQKPGRPMVRVWFADNGIGIAKEDQQKIFGMFQRVDRHYQGTGIGLALVRKNAERMGGNVGVESDLGKGSRFWLDLRPA